MENIIVVPGLFGGKEKSYYDPIVELVGPAEYSYIFRAGADWDPYAMAEEIMEIEGRKKVICLSLGAMVGSILAGREDVEVYYVCPYLDVEFLNRRTHKKAYAFRRFFRGLASVLMAITKPFKNHRWYPLYGGTKPDGWYLSVYAICQQLRYAFSEGDGVIKLVDGVVFSYDDTVVEPDLAQMTSRNIVTAWLEPESDGRPVYTKGPSHVNLRREGEAYGSKAATTGDNLSRDAKAYVAACDKMFKHEGRRSFVQREVPLR